MKKIALLIPGSLADAAVIAQMQQQLLEALPRETVVFKDVGAGLQARADQLLEYLQAPDIDAIWCVRGGYGSAELLNLFIQSGYPYRLQQAVLSKKVIIGYSDCCHLLHFLEKQGAQVIHGPVALNLVPEQGGPISAGCNRILAFLRRERLAGFNIELQALNYAARDTIVGRLTGGNLSKVAQALGYNRYPDAETWTLGPNCYPELSRVPGRLLLTPELQTVIAPELKDRLLLLEDIDETVMTVRHMLNYLWHTIKAKGISIKGIVFGTFHGIEEYDLLDCLRTWVEAARISCPVFYTRAIGHEGPNEPMSFTGEVVIQKQPGWQLTLSQFPQRARRCWFARTFTRRAFSPLCAMLRFHSPFQ